MRNFKTNHAVIFVGCCIFSTGTIGDSKMGDTNRANAIKSAQKISTEFMEFFDEFSDDEESVVQLLVEDSAGNIMIGSTTAGDVNNPDAKNEDIKNSEKFRRKRFNQSASSQSVSSVGGEKR